MNERMNEKLVKSVEEREEAFKKILEEFNTYHLKTIAALEEIMNEEFKTVDDLSNEFPEGAFEKNKKEIELLRAESLELKKELGSMQEEIKKKAISKFVFMQCTNFYSKVTDLMMRSAESIKNLHTNIKLQLSLKVSEAQEKILNAKLDVVNNIEKSLSNFIEKQQAKLFACRDKLESSKKEIEEKGIKNNEKKGRTK